MNRHNEPKREAEPPVELESQFILRLPPEPAKVLREAIRSGVVHLKDRLSIKLENDMRYGEVRVDHWLMPAKIMDLPSIVESLKTIDNKSFYKTADICQILICKEEDDQTPEEEGPVKTKKKDPNKVDKKFLWPHGITPPLKNVRKRRFRKTLKKKYVEAPEIEKEVKRLLRVDNEAVSVKWEVICDDDKAKVIKPFSNIDENSETGPTRNVDTSIETSNPHSVDVAEHEIFGEAVSDSEEEETKINVTEFEEETSRPSADDSHMSDSTSLQGLSASRDRLVTEFTTDMFSAERNYSEHGPKASGGSSLKQEQQNEFGEQSGEYQRVKQEVSFEYDIFKNDLNPVEESEYNSNSQMSKEAVKTRLTALEAELADLRTRRQQQELEIANIENHALRVRFLDILDNLLAEQLEKEQEYQELTSLIQMHEAQGENNKQGSSA
ncbi:transcription initiation factor TFIID subunit 7 [Schistocerca cancellata]|uniref:transcription initiation factor TFIID subunit 7 n=1 Tax=Schistocerca cancellata TaxID=274614 RepID=UPI0021190FEE|nr:transcription initiation factor TFIID subunit 7 [Schistocerca cancellata]